MIRPSSDFDLGRDRTRIKDPGDGKRQTATVDEILRRFFDDNYNQRIPIQVLADEVGMGKTFVALAVAFSILKAMREDQEDEDLRGCYQRVLIITPPNEALFLKWQNETGEFVQRCVKKDGNEARKWFASRAVKRIDELSEELRRPGSGPRVLITTMGMFAGVKIRDYDIKRRFLLGVLFRHWGVRFRYDQRVNLLKGAPEGWPSNPDELLYMYEYEWESIPFKEEEALNALGEIERLSREDLDLPSMEDLLEKCRQIAEPYQRNRTEDFNYIERKLAELYKTVAAKLILQAFPIVIVDEAHNWKNGPQYGTNGYWYFSKFIAGCSRRALLLTATPFQLRPEEMIEILKVSDSLMPSPLQKESEDIRQRIKKYRELTLLPALKHSERASKVFVRCWSKLSSGMTAKKLEETWGHKSLIQARRLFRRMAIKDGKLENKRVEKVISSTMKYIEPELRPFFGAVFKLYTYNAGLSQELGKFVIRHRRRTEHRLFRVGREFTSDFSAVIKRSDAHLLHGAPGLDVLGKGELPHYILMRCVSEMKRLKGRRGRSSLGNTLTGCYSTLLHSAEGRSVQEWLNGSLQARNYLNLMMSMVSQEEDTRHPKVVPVLNYALDNWRRGEKTLIFCFRVNTAERLRDIIDSRIDDELNTRAKSCLGGEDKLTVLKSRLTSRMRDLIVVGLDRVLWSLAWRGPKERSSSKIEPTMFKLTESDLQGLARLSLLYGMPLTGERVDRVFLARATEFVLAKRILPSAKDEELRYILDRIADESWISSPYGLETKTDIDATAGERSEFDERGVHGIYKQIRGEPSFSEIEVIANILAATRAKARQTGQIPVLDVYAEGPNLFLGDDPIKTYAQSRSELGTSKLLREIHNRLWSLTFNREGRMNWESRRKVMQSIRRATLRNSVLVRLLPEKSELEDSLWGELLVSAFFKPMPGQRESLADRITVFLEDLDAAGGDLAATDVDQRGMRYAMYDATRLTDQFVALVKGGGGSTSIEHRNRVFTGFNTPLLPEVLICTQIGQEGIDLHRHCRHVIHYDLAWNPAVLEQRTGRADRIGSKTFREREGYELGQKPRLEVGVPFLAGTYDERMFEELRIRAQTFEVLTGGDFAADNAEGTDVGRQPEGCESGIELTSLPIGMLKEMRVNLHVWQE